MRLPLQGGAVSLLVLCVYHTRAARAGMLCRPLWQWLGRLSYGVYLWNVPIFKAMLRSIGPALSERWVERSCIRLSQTLRMETQPLGSVTPPGGHAPRRARSRA